MRLSRLLPAMLLVIAGLPPTTSAADLATFDLAKIDRTLKDEPKYRTKNPTYCLLVFGQEAKTRVWLVRDGGTLHVYASPDGKAPKVWRQVKLDSTTFRIGDVWEDGGAVRHQRLRYNPNSRNAPLAVHEGGSKLWTAGKDRRGKIEFAPTAAAAPVVHFFGPLALDLYHDQQPLMSGLHEDLSVVVGTRGVGAGAFATMHCDSYPRNAWPTAVIEFPRKGGGLPVVTRVRLAEN